MLIRIYMYSIVSIVYSTELAELAGMWLLDFNYHFIGSILGGFILFDFFLVVFRVCCFISKILLILLGCREEDSIPAMI
jgi:hypothetical protein